MIEVCADQYTDVWDHVEIAVSLSVYRVGGVCMLTPHVVALRMLPPETCSEGEEGEGGACSWGEP